LLPDGHAAKVDCDKEWCPYSKIERIARATLAAHRATQPDDGPRPLAGDDDAIAIVMNMFDLEYVEADGLLAALDEHLRGTP
jgi:hypothetical protein